MEGLYVSLSRVKFKNDIRLLLKDGDRSTMNYISDLTKNESVQAFFDGYKRDKPMNWNKNRAAKNASLV